MAIKYRVETVESERGWGQTYEYSYFDTREEAQEFINKINSMNTEKTVPDWYMMAFNEIAVIEMK